MLVSAHGIVKRFGDNTVLREVDLQLEPGRVHGLVGHNGAGKSTLANIMTGRLSPDGGEVRVDGQAVHFAGVKDAARAGIYAVPQEMVLPAGMSVREVVTLGHEPSRAAFVSRRRERMAVRDVLRRLGLSVDIESPVRRLPVSWQRVVLVAQVLHRNARTVMLDEPTAAMNAEDADEVQALVRTLRSDGVSVLYISHRFDEVERLCDLVTVLRDGERVAVLEDSGVRQQRLVEEMMGEDGPILGVRGPRTNGRAKVTDHKLRARGADAGVLRDFAIEVTGGEIVGIAGLPGSGVEEAFAVLGCTVKPDTGALTVDERRVTSVRAALDNGITYLPASRAAAALPDAPALDNLMLPSLRPAGRSGVLSRGQSRRYADSVVRRLNLRPVRDRSMRLLSGGNQQRVLVGARLLARPRFLVLEDPTVGVDIGARAELHELIRSLASEGLGCVVGSSEPKELVELCDRVHVIRGGRCVSVLRGESLSEFALVAAMTAQQPDPAEPSTVGPKENNDA